MNGVIDTRSAGLNVIDIRDEVAAVWLREAANSGAVVHEGVVDNRPTSVTDRIGPVISADAPAVVNPFETAAPASGIDWGVAEFAPASDAAHASAVPTVSAAAAAPPMPPPPIVTRAPQLSRAEMRRLEAKSTRRGAQRRGASTLGLPQVGIVSVLGLATIAAPLTGVFSAPAKAGANALSESATEAVVVAAPPVVVAAQFPQTAPRINAVEEARVVVDDARLAAVPSTLAAPSRVLSRSAKAGKTVTAVLPGCDGTVTAAATSASNGELPRSVLCTLWNKEERLRADSAVDLAVLNVAYRKEFGKDLCIIDGYRTLAEQYRVKRLRGGYAAAPGTSEHGWGLAIDLCGGGGVAGTPTYKWMRANAEKYGWRNPDWALSTGSGPYEPWHWEYVRGQDADHQHS